MNTEIEPMNRCEPEAASTPHHPSSTIHHPLLLRIGAFEPRSLANGPGARAVLWVQGCGRRCRGCFNPEFLPREGGRRVPVEEVIQWIREAAGAVAAEVTRLGRQMPKSESRNPKEGRSPKSEMSLLTGVLPKSSAPAKVGRVSPSAPALVAQTRTFRRVSAPRGALGETRPTSDPLGQNALTSVAKEVHPSSTIHHPPSILEGVTFSGGEPFDQAAELALVARAARQIGLSVLIFTGYPWEELEPSADAGHRALLAEADLLVAGPYERDTTIPHPSIHSSNNPAIHSSIIHRSPSTIHHPLLASPNQRLVLLSDRYRAHDFSQKRRIEFRIAPDGTVRTTGFPSHHPPSIIHHPPAHALD